MESWSSSLPVGSLRLRDVIAGRDEENDAGISPRDIRSLRALAYTNARVGVDGPELSVRHVKTRRSRDNQTPHNVSR